jgi:hypothetical protein
MFPAVEFLPAVCFSRHDCRSHKQIEARRRASKALIRISMGYRALSLTKILLFTYALFCHFTHSDVWKDLPSIAIHK